MDLNAIINGTQQLTAEQRLRLLKAKERDIKQKKYRSEYNQTPHAKAYHSKYNKQRWAEQKLANLLDSKGLLTPEAEVND